MMLLPLYNSAVVAANYRRGGLDRILTKPLATEVRRRFRARPETRDDPSSAIALRLERCHGRAGGSRVNPVALEPVSDAFVPESPVGEGVNADLA